MSRAFSSALDASLTQDSQSASHKLICKQFFHLCTFVLKLTLPVVLYRRLWTPTLSNGVQQSWQNPTSLGLMIVRMRVEFGTTSTKQQIFLNGELKDEVTSTMPQMGPDEIDEAEVSYAARGPYMIGLQSKSVNSSGNSNHCHSVMPSPCNVLLL